MERSSPISVISCCVCRCLPVLLPLLMPLQLSAQPGLQGGSACVVAKRQGNSLAVEWSLGQPSVASAISSAKDALRKKGYEEVFPQANSAHAHGWMVVIKTRYRTYTGRMRVSYGCGFSERSDAAAEQLATRDLRTFSWGWRPEMGYEVVERERY